MYYELKDNQIIILDKNKKETENATANGNECKYCIYIYDCNRPEKDLGSYCDGMKCRFKEIF